MRIVRDHQFLKQLVAGLLIRIACITLFIPKTQRDWFLPFLEHAFEHVSLDPWTNWIQVGGDVLAFPYGVIGLVLGFPIKIFEQIGVAPSVAFPCSLLIVDALTGLMIGRIEPHGWFQKMWLLSPLVIFMTYVHGQTDLLIGLSILLALVATKSGRWSNGGFLLGLGALAKLSALLPIPSITLFILTGRRQQRIIGSKLLLVAFGVVAIGCIPGLYSSGFRTMVFGSREIGGLFDHTISIGSGNSFLLMPAVFSILLYFQYRQRKVGVDSLITYIIASIIVVVLLAPSSDSWYLWFIPSLALIADLFSSTEKVGFWALQVLIVVKNVINVEQGVWRFGELLTVGGYDLPASVRSVLDTLTFVLGVSLFVSIIRKGFSAANSLRLGQRPVLVAIAGNSGVGKDTLVNNLMHIFPKDSAHTICGDDYHLYERGARQWNSVTHLNPLANDLSQLRSDVKRIRDGHKIIRRTYDHTVGRFVSSEPICPREVLLVNGLHAIYLESEKLKFDLKVFLSMDESLRLSFKLERDTRGRNSSDSVVIQSELDRSRDATSFVDPQVILADVAIHLSRIETVDGLSPIRCQITTRQLGFLEQLHREILLHTRCPSSLTYNIGRNEIQLEVIPESLSVDEICRLGELLLPNQNELTLRLGNFQSGSTGFISLVALLGLIEKRVSLD